MKRVTLAAWLVLAVSLSALRAADEPAIRPDPRPTDLTSGRRGSNDEPAIRDEPRARDFSAPRTSGGRSTVELSGMTGEQSDKIRAIRDRAAAEIQTIRDRERAEIMALLNDEQRAQYQKHENDQGRDRPRRVNVTTAPATTQAAP